MAIMRKSLFFAVLLSFTCFVPSIAAKLTLTGVEAVMTDGNAALRIKGSAANKGAASYKAGAVTAYALFIGGDRTVVAKTETVRLKKLPAGGRVSFSIPVDSVPEGCPSTCYFRVYLAVNGKPAAKSGINSIETEETDQGGVTGGAAEDKPSGETDYDNEPSQTTEEPRQTAEELPSAPEPEADNGNDRYPVHASRHTYGGGTGKELIDPIKGSLTWSAQTAPKGTLVASPFLWHESVTGVYDQNGNFRSSVKWTDWGVQTPLNYGITDRFEVSIAPSISYTPDAASDNLAVGDMPIFVRYAIDGIPEPYKLTAAAGYIMPIRKYDGYATSTERVSLGLQFTTPIDPFMLHANLYYNLGTTTHGTTYPATIRYGVDFEYFTHTIRQPLILQMERYGLHRGEYSQGGHTISDTMSSGLVIVPGIATDIGEDVRVRLMYDFILSGKNLLNQDILWLKFTKSFPNFGDLFK